MILCPEVIRNGEVKCFVVSDDSSVTIYGRAAKFQCEKGHLSQYLHW